MNKALLAGLVFSVSTLVACGQDTNSNIDLARVSSIAKSTLESMGSSASKDGDAAVAELRKKFEQNLNTSRPMVFPEGYIAVTSEKDGSFKGYNDINNDHTQQAGEDDLFKIEIDGVNNRVLASNPQETETASSPFSGMLMGMMMGMLMGNLMNRQRSAGTNPSQKQATKSASSSKAKSSRSTSARSRSGSGSHARGK